MIRRLNPVDSWDVGIVAQPRVLHCALRWGISALAAVIALCATCSVARGEEGNSDFSLSDLPALKQAGIEANVWGWGTFGFAGSGDERTSWGTEFELDLTKTFAHRVSVAADLEVFDYNDHIRGNFEQLFVSILLSPDSGTLLTGGKFNSPWGVEPRDFWDRLTATPSLLFRAQPQDLRGIMLTAPIGDTGVTIRPFVVSGFNDEDSIPHEPAGGLMVEYAPSEQLHLAVTNWFGPGLEPRSAAFEAAEEEEYESAAETSDEVGDPEAEGEEAEYGGGYGSSVFASMDTWSKNGFKSAYGGTLYFLDAQATWKPRTDITLSAEYLLGSSRFHEGNGLWQGVMALANYDLNDHWRVYGQWSFLDDADAAVTGIEQQLQEVNVGVGYRLNRHIEVRGEVRHDWGPVLGDVNSVTVAASFGY